jgi:hypothetical protein
MANAQFIASVLNQAEGFISDSRNDHASRTLVTDAVQAIKELKSQESLLTKEVSNLRLNEKRVKELKQKMIDAEKQKAELVEQFGLSMSSLIRELTPLLSSLDQGTDTQAASSDGGFAKRISQIRAILKQLIQLYDKHKQSTD